MLRRDSRRGAAPFANQLCVMRAECARGTRMRSDGIGFRDSPVEIQFFSSLLTLWTPHASLLFLAVDTVTMPKKVLIINTSADKFGGGNTGVWLEECAAPYYIFTEAGLEVEMANILGGPSPIDAGSMGEGFFTEASKKFMHDATAYGMFSHQKKLSDVDATSYDAIYLSGGHGTCTDFADNKVLKAAIEGCLAAGKVVAADCHGP